MNDAVRVVHVAETIKGGIATYLRNLAPLQAARYGRENVRVLVPADQAVELDGADVPIVSFPNHRSRLITAIAAARALHAQLREFVPSVAHIHSSFAGLTCRPLLRCTSRRPRVVYCPHGWAFARAYRDARLVAWVEWLAAPLCDAVVCVSRAERNDALLAGLSDRKLHVILSGLPDRIPAPTCPPCAGASPLRLLFVGRLDRQKGFDVLTAALSRVQRPVQVNVFGESVLGESAAIDLPKCVRLRGWQPFSAIEPFLRRCDALVMPSRWEAFGLSAVEAMRAGKAVIASRVGGLPELVEDGVTGRLVPPDDASALAQVLDGVQRDQLAAMGAMGRARFLERFRVEACEEHLAKLYEELLAGASGTGTRT